MSLKDLQPIVPKANLEDYIVTIYGQPKVGKTTLAFNIGKEQFGSTNETLILGFEDGFKALTGAMAQSIKDWSHFLELSEELIEDKDELPFKLLVFDTVDAMSNMASKYVAKRKTREDKKKYRTAKSIPWGIGADELRTEIDDAIKKLQKEGYGIILITHEKEKKIEPKIGSAYHTTSFALEGKVTDAIKDMSDFIVYLSIERKSNKDEGSRYMYFRGESMFEAGSRFSKIKSKVPYGAKNFIEVVREAVENANEGIDSVNDVEEDEPSAQTEDVAEENEAVEVDEKALRTELQNRAKALKGEAKTDFRDHLLEEYGTTKFAEITQISDLFAIQEHLNGL